MIRNPLQHQECFLGKRGAQSYRSGTIRLVYKKYVQQERLCIDNVVLLLIIESIFPYKHQNIFPS